MFKLRLNYWLLTISLAFLLLPQSAWAYNPPPADNILALFSGLKIVLPPAVVSTPDQLRLGSGNCLFTDLDKAGSKLPQDSSACPNNKIRAISNKVSFGSNNLADYYVIRVFGFKAKDNLADLVFRLTYKANSVNSAKLGQLQADIIDKPNNYQDRAELRTNDCTLVPSDLNAASDLCLKTASDIRLGGRRAVSQPKYIIQRIALKNILVEGNVAGGQGIAQFNVEDNAIVVGGTITDVQGGSQQLQDYYRSAKFAWTTDLTKKVETIFNQARSQGTSIAVGSHTSSLHLNATTFGSTNTSSFSTNPEGKLWFREGDLSFKDIDLKGSGTIVVNGNVSIDGVFNCDSGARLGIIASGSVTFAGSIKNVGCGAYFATGDKSDITFKNTTGQARDIILNGIFVARRNVTLPASTTLVGNYKINYDKVFAANPTINFRELLSVIFSAGG